MEYNWKLVIPEIGSLNDFSATAADFPRLQRDQMLE